MSNTLRPGKKFKLRSSAPSRSGLRTNEVITFVSSNGGGKVKDDLMPITYRFKREDGSEWIWKLSLGELLSGWIEEA
jgi:hypothetical protein